MMIRRMFTREGGASSPRRLSLCTSLLVGALTLGSCRLPSDAVGKGADLSTRGVDCQMQTPGNYGRFDVAVLDALLRDAGPFLREHYRDGTQGRDLLLLRPDTVGYGQYVAGFESRVIAAISWVELSEEETSKTRQAVNSLALRNQETHSLAGRFTPTATSRLLRSGDPESGRNHRSLGEAGTSVLGILRVHLPGYASDGRSALVAFSFAPTPHGNLIVASLILTGEGWVTDRIDRYYYF